jgi:hypothetical protein
MGEGRDGGAIETADASSPLLSSGGSYVWPLTSGFRFRASGFRLLPPASRTRHTNNRELRSGERLSPLPTSLASPVSIAPLPSHLPSPIETPLSHLHSFPRHWRRRYPRPEAKRSPLPPLPRVPGRAALL